MISRRDVIARLSTLAGTTGLAGCGRRSDSNGQSTDSSSTNRHPTRQHAWDDVLSTDSAGNSLLPRYHAVILLELSEQPTADHRTTVERALETIDAAFERSPDGLLSLIAWGTSYFRRFGALDEAPIRRPRVISRIDEPVIQSFDAALVLASDVQSTLSAVQGAMFGSRDRLGQFAVDARLGQVFTPVERRKGFIGTGLPAAHARAEGLSAASNIPDDAPMFSGFFSGRRNTQASEDRVTIQRGQFAGGTTMHLAKFDFDLQAWHRLPEERRVELMFSGTLDRASLDDAETDVPVTDNVTDHAAKYDLVGHHEKVKRVREDDEPLILRRDFNTIDGGNPGLHFLSLQRTMADFAKTRDAMNGWWLRDESPQITDRRNNGILDFITEQSIAAFYVPPRPDRSFPLYEGS